MTFEIIAIKYLINKKKYKCHLSFYVNFFFKITGLRIFKINWISIMILCIVFFR